ncbi:hypothetical protein B0T22DRAFT_65433 [Podospora appendiculata]|uniref:AAA+ ATPase domain-containing protein n=1 Tax=Podospora appendiculata TaxID=314037 RepID=A0AAE0XJ58_9PEZI|nr:hypothetical protein B0T22DRAFT_65433 [Podospora appendiculata]
MANIPTFIDNLDDDESCSITSYENIGPGRNRQSIIKGLIAHAPGKRSLADDEMPDILYVVQYCNDSGRVYETRESDKPLDTPTTTVPSEGPGSRKKPVIEIKTQVTVSTPTPRTMGRNRPNDRRRRYSFDDDGDRYDYNYRDDKEVDAFWVERPEMTIYSPHLLAALNAVVGFYPSFESFMGEQVVIESPYQVLVHHWKALELYKMNQPACHDAEYATTTTKHIDVLLSFLRTTFAEKMDAEAKRWNAGAATFDLLWLLLKPGEIIYKEDEGLLTPYILNSVRRTRESENPGRGAYQVDFWNIEYKDGRLRRLMKSIFVDPWNGDRQVDTLPVIPARFVPGGAKAVAEKQIQLGKMYWELSKQPCYREYDGPLISTDGNRGGNMTGRVIVDCEGFELYGSRQSSRKLPPPRDRRRPRSPSPPGLGHLPAFQPCCTCASCMKTEIDEEPSPFAGFDKLDPTKDDLPANQDLYFHILGKTVPAFVLGDRRWSYLQLESLRDVKADREAFKYLVLDSEIKLTVKALIGKFASSDGKVSPWPSDFVKNKGEGRIFLLHGSPGVGKTCTAECVAELTQRPLLSLTSGDISTSMSAGSVERHLNYFLALGERFGALVLLDEADVFLEERRTRDLRRNGLVSIFLRALEYYRGVLFLTTNRVEAFDSAFTSRIHVALHYRRLNDEDRKRIWLQNFERLGE